MLASIASGQPYAPDTVIGAGFYQNLITCTQEKAFQVFMLAELQAVAPNNIFKLVSIPHFAVEALYLSTQSLISVALTSLFSIRTQAFSAGFSMLFVLIFGRFSPPQTSSP